MEITILSDMSEGRQVQSSRDDPRQYNLQMGTGADAGFVFQTYATTGFATATLQTTPTLTSCSWRYGTL